MEHDSAETAVHTPKFSGTHHKRLCHRYSQKKIWVKSAFDGSTGGTYSESKEYGFWDDTCGQESNMSRIFLDAIAPSLPARGAYKFMDMGDRPDSGKIEIKWEEDGEMKYAVVEW